MILVPHWSGAAATSGEQKERRNAELKIELLVFGLWVDARAICGCTYLCVCTLRVRDMFGQGVWS